MLRSVAAVGLLLVLAPIAVHGEPGPEVPRWEMRADGGTPVEADCSPDTWVWETAGPQPDGTMLLPHDGCAVAYGPELTNGSIPLSVYYRVSGHEGEVCGYFTFSGSHEGASAPTCSVAGGDGVTRMPVHVVAGNGTHLTVTWHPTSQAGADAYVCSFTMAGGPPVPQPETTDCFAPSEGTGTITGTPPEAQVPFFPGATALLLASLGAVAAAVILVRRK